MISPKPWEQTMDPEEVAWCEAEIDRVITELDEPCVDNQRAARLWKSAQRRRFRKQAKEGCCGSHEWIAERWNPQKLRVDLYLLGFNYGH